MPSPLQKVPAGVLELFALKTLGRNASMFGDQVVPTFESRDFYSADLLVSQATQTGGTATGGNAAITVPAGEVWLVDALSADVTLVAGASFTSERISVVLSAQRAAGVSVHLHAQNFDASVYATPIVLAETLSVGFFFARPLVAMPGTLLRADFLYRNSGTALDQFLQVRYARLGNP